MFKNIGNITLLKNEPLKEHCAFKVGGNAKFFVKALTVDSFIDSLYFCKQHNIKCRIIGGGSNILFDDKGFDGAIIQLVSERILIKDNILKADCGTSIAKLISATVQNNLCGFEYAIGVPALLGGALVNNLGAHDESIDKYLTEIAIIRNKQLLFLKPDECKFTYHSSSFQNSKDILLSATFNLPAQNADITRAKAQHLLNKRTISQPLQYPNAGSIFKRTENIIPAKLIDEAGLKGLSVNDAQVSVKHSGFIINKGQATSKDILQLIEIVKQKVYEKFNISLELEIEYIQS